MSMPLIPRPMPDVPSDDMVAEQTVTDWSRLSDDERVFAFKMRLYLEEMELPPAIAERLAQAPQLEWRAVAELVAGGCPARLLPKILL